MGKLDTESVVTLVINGEQSKTTLKEVTQAVNSLRAELSNLREEDNPELYQEKIEKLQEMREAQMQMRDAIFASREESKGFFADWKKGFEEIEQLAAAVTLGTIISSVVRSGIRAVEEFFSEAEEKFKANEVTQAQLAAALKSTGGAAGETMAQLKKYQEQLSEQDAVEEAVVAKSEELLLTFTNIKGVVYEKALPSIMDMTAALNGGKITMEGVQKVTIQVGKALQDPIAGLTALRRVGVTFNEQQKEQITLMVRSGNTMGAQMLILKELQKEFGGTAAAIKNTATGALQMFSVDMDKLEERVGSWMTRWKSVWANAFDPLVKSIGDARTEAEKLTDAYNDQKESVDKLQAGTRPLLDRYDELTSKGKLNSDEQVELKKVIAQIADEIPSAVTQWDKYGNAIEVSTKKGRDFIAVQKALLKYQNKDAIDANKAALQKLESERDQIVKELNSGQTEDFTGGSGLGAGATYATREYTPEEIQKMRAALKQLTDQISDANNTIKGLTGNYLDDLNKQGAQTIQQVKKLSEMTIGELQEHLQTLNLSLKETVMGSVEYKKIMEDINATEKLLNQENDDKHGDKKALAAAEKIKREKEKAARELAEYQKQLQDLQGQIDALIGKATKGTIAGLDDQLKIINDKYTQLINKIKAIDTNKNATPADHKKNASDIKNLQTSQTAAGLDAIESADYKNDLEALKQYTQQKMNVLDDQRANDTINEQQYQEKKDKIEKAALAEQYELEMMYGESTLDTEKRMGDLEVREAQRVANAKKKAKEDELKTEKAFSEEKKKLAETEMNLAQSGFDLAQAIFGKSKALKIAEIAFEKMVDVGKIEAAKEVEIAGYFAAYSAIPGGVIVAGALAAAAEARADIAIAATLASGLAQAVNTVNSGNNSKSSNSKTKMADGGVIQGPSHATGGVPLINGHTGEQIAELEGGESMAVFSKNTTDNNRMAINELLHNSQYRNGAPLTANAPGIVSAMQHYRYGNDQFSHATGLTNSGSPGGGSQGGDMTETNRLLGALHDKFEDFSNKPFKFDHKAFEEYTGTVANSRAAANAA